MQLSDLLVAEQNFRDAFDRLKKNKPIILSKGSQVTQNNVAREAGRDPSALRKSRYPILVLEIQSHLSTIAENSQKKKTPNDSRRKTAEEKNKDYLKQIDMLSSIVLSQNAIIEELNFKIEQLKSKKVSHLDSLDRG